ncbi:MAG: hypothetical protein U9P00_04500 [Pseudomonadota bacterium]|nr:hypothetical protein [Pseudomonadota bacterium]
MNRKRTLKLVTYSDADSTSPAVSLSTRALLQQNHIYRETDGVSGGNRDQGFRPVFLDQSTGITWLSRFADGRIAPLHVLDGLPDELIAARDVNGHVRTARDCVIAGFLRGGLFYTREQAARAVAH